MTGDALLAMTGEVLHRHCERERSNPVFGALPKEEMTHLKMTGREDWIASSLRSSQ
jgi:hypothetical protein